MNKPELFDENHEATYCPEDDKLRLYVGRVPRDEYEALRKEGWTSTPKQSCDFVAYWTPQREQTALKYAGIIGDEDQDPADRAADRAERFAGYLGKRMDEAGEHADRYEGQDTAHGYQNAERAARAAARHDRIADRAINSWDKAEYWERRTRGVISHALYKSEPGVRMGRIKKLEAELRKVEKDARKHAARYAAWKKAEAIQDPQRKRELVEYLAGMESGFHDYPHPRPQDCTDERYRTKGGSLWSLLTTDKGRITPEEALALWFSRHPDQADREGSNSARWRRHYENRLAYERQMLEAQGGRLEQEDIEPGGKFGGKLILKASKSNATGRVTSVSVLGPKVSGWTYKAKNIPGTEWAEYKFETERYEKSYYTPPTPESLAELASVKATIKEAAKKTAPEAIPLINPTDADAERVQAALNAKANKRLDEYDRKNGLDYSSEVARMTQAQYKIKSAGSYGQAETKFIGPDLLPTFRRYYGNTSEGSKFKIRLLRSSELYNADRVIILTDKPQKPLPIPTQEEPQEPPTPEPDPTPTPDSESQPVKAQAVLFPDLEPIPPPRYEQAALFEVMA